MELTSPTYIAKEKVQTVQDYVLFCVQAVANLFRKPLYFADMVRQADAIGVGSLPIVVLTGFFTGAVLALQASNTLERFGSITLVGQLVSTSMVRELGPVLTSLMDMSIGVLIAFRRTAAFGLVAGIIASLGYMGGSAILTPDLWIEPLGALVKTGPAIVLMLVALLMLDNR